MCHKGAKFACMFLILLSLAACSTANSTTSLSEGTGQQETASTPAASQSSSQPAGEAEKTAPAVQVDEAKLQELASQFSEGTPAKSITLSVSITELFDALKLELTGVPTTKSTLPEAYTEVPRVGSSHQPDLEQIAKLEPSIVLAPASIKNSIDKMLKPAGIPAAYLPADSLDELKLSTAVLGRVYNKEEQATQVLEDFAKKEAEAIEASKGKDAPKVMILFGSAESLMVMNENTFAGSIAHNLGAANVLSDVLKQTETYVPLNMESIVTANPDVILLVAHGDPAAVAQKFEEDVKKNGAWEKLAAFQNGKLKTLDYNLFGIASLVKAPDAYKEMANILYN